jgi:hypothetical protein
MFVFSILQALAAILFTAIPAPRLLPLTHIDMLAAAGNPH